MSGWRVPVGGQMYEVKLESEVENGKNSGQVDADLKIIHIDADDAKDEQKLLSIYLHEIIHCYQFEGGWGEILKKESLEIWAEGLANQLLGSFELKIKKY
jgi:hypothetical protein